MAGEPVFSSVTNSARRYGPLSVFVMFSREKLAEIAEHPQVQFDPEIVELDPAGETLSFSERVRKNRDISTENLSICLAL